MSNGLNLALVIRGDASGAKQAAAETRSAVNETTSETARGAAAMQAANDQAAASVRRVTEALTGQAQAQRNLQAAVASFAGVRSPANDDAYKQRAADVAAYGASLDALRAKYNPLFAAELAHVRNLGEIDRALKVGALTEKEHAEAVARAASAYELQRAGLDAVAGSALAAKLQLEDYSRQALAARQQLAADRAQVEVNQLLGVRDPSAMAGSAKGSASAFLAMPEAQEGAKNVALANHEMTNLTYQMNDIAMMLASGQSPFIMMMQQGSQITQIMGKRGVGEILPALAGAITNLISPTTMLLAGITAGGYAAYAAYRMVVPEVRELDDIMERHRDLLEGIKEGWRESGAEARNYSRESRTILMSRAKDESQTLQERLNDAGQDIYRDVMGGASQVVDLPQLLPKWAVGRSATLGPIYDEILKLNASAKEGAADFLSFRWELTRIARDQSLSVSLRDKAKNLRDLTDEFAKGQRQLLEYEDAAKRFPTAMAVGRDMTGYSAYLASQKVASERAQETFDAQRRSLFARSPNELAAAARATAAAQHENDEDPQARNRRINMAGQMAYLQAQHQLVEAQNERKLSLDATIESQKLEIALIGRSAAEADGLRMAYQLEQEVREEAARNNVEVDEAEIARIREKAAELGKLRALQGAREMLRDQDEEMQRLRVEQALIGTSAGLRARLTAQMEAEFDIRRRGIDSMGEEAQRIRAQAAAIADVTVALERQQDAWKMVQSAGESAIDSLLDGDWKSAADDIIKSAIQLNIANPLKNWALGTNNPTGADLGSNILGRLFGGADAGAENAVSSILGGSKSTATMSVNAGVVNVNGALGVGGGTGGLGDTVSRLLKGGNDNYAPGAVTRLPLGDLASYREAIKSVESAGSGGYSALGPMLKNGNQALGAYQVMSNNLPSWSQEALGKTLSPSQFLADPNAQDKVFDHFFGKSLQKYGNAQDAASVWFTGRPQSGAAGSIDVLGTTGTEYVDKFNNALGRLDDTTTSATKNLGTFGNGLGQLGNSMSNVFPAAPSGGGGGLGGILGSLLGGGGLNSAFAGSSAYSWLSANPGDFIGLYSDGGYTGPGAVNEPRGVVHAGEVVWSQKNVADAGGPAVVEAMRLGRRGYAGGGAVDGGYAIPAYGAAGSAMPAMVATGQIGRSVIELRLSSELVGSILEQAANQSVEIVQANDKARTALWNEGGDPK